MNEEEFEEVIILAKLGQSVKIDAGALKLNIRYTEGTWQFCHDWGQSPPPIRPDIMWFNISYEDLRNLLIDGIIKI